MPLSFIIVQEEPHHTHTYSRITLPGQKKRPVPRLNFSVLVMNYYIIKYQTSHMRSFANSTHLTTDRRATHLIHSFCQVLITDNINSPCILHPSPFALYVVSPLLPVKINNNKLTQIAVIITTQVQAKDKHLQNNYTSNTPLFSFFLVLKEMHTHKVIQ